MGKLFDDADDVTISVNKKFAEHFQKKKEREQLQQLNEKYGDESVSPRVASFLDDITARICLNPAMRMRTRMLSS
jgi:UDP-N-acetylglucosamine 2-epimerase